MFSDDGWPTTTSEEQQAVEKEVLKLFSRALNKSDFDANEDIQLNRSAHVAFLKRGLTEPLRSSFISLEASQPWIVYWILHALDLLGEHGMVLGELSQGSIKFLRECQNACGGFGGGPDQISHLATTYAAVAALVTIGTPEALGVIDVDSLSLFLSRMKDPVSGGFRMHEDGEIDIRGTYCAVAVFFLCNLGNAVLLDKVPEYVGSCQTYEGGIAGEPGMEAHGGYTYCGLAALALGVRGSRNINNYLNVDALVEWLGRRQMVVEGGFQGRANKLVDSCYTFWQGACFSILHDMVESDLPLACSAPVQMYVLLACQGEYGGFRDKPGKNADYYHSCYALSGLAAVQQSANLIVGHAERNALQKNNVLFNVVQDRVDGAMEFWHNRKKMEVK